MPTLARSSIISPRPISDRNLLARCPYPRLRVGDQGARRRSADNFSPDAGAADPRRRERFPARRRCAWKSGFLPQGIGRPSADRLLRSRGVLGHFVSTTTYGSPKCGACLPAVASYGSMPMHEFPVQNPMEPGGGTAKFPIFNKLYPSGFSPTRWAQNRSKAQMRHDIERFPPKSGSGLRYQACPIPRIVRPSDMPVCGDRQFVYRF
jgi:hypothetical protein